MPFHGQGGLPGKRDGDDKGTRRKDCRRKVAFFGKDQDLLHTNGNVLFTRGSEVPLWIEQIKNGQPVTLTDGKMTRFIMSLDEAMELVLYVFENGRNGDIFVKKAPACTMLTQAEAVCELCGADTGLIRQIGIRHGEKMFETLLTAEESIRAEDLGEYFRISADARDLNYDGYYTEGDTDADSGGGFNSNNARLLSKDEVKEKIAMSASCE